MTKFDTIHGDMIISTLERKNAGSGGFYVLGILIISLIAFAPIADAGCSCSVGNWDPSGFLNDDSVTVQGVQPGGAQGSQAGNSGNSTPNSGISKKKPLDRVDSFPNGEILKSLKSVSSSDVVVDVSNGDSYAKSHIENAIHIPTKDFLDGAGNLKTDEELATILGAAGVSRDDSVVLYGNLESSGEAEFAFLVLQHLGQKDVKLLDGSLTDWKAAGLPEEALENKKPGVEYKPEVKPKIIAQFDYVKSEKAQIVDVRPFVEFGKGRIPGSVALDPANIIKGNLIKNEGDLSTVFDRLSKDKPIVVYSSDYSRSSLVWYALQLMGYNASVYTWEDWKAHEATGKGVQAGATAPSGGKAAGSKYTKLGST
jgi:thiosulfate/3-mercaptopyruvate sulfurtransferase